MLVVATACCLWRNTSGVPPFYNGVQGQKGPPVFDPYLEFARGSVDGISTVNVFGRNIEIDAAGVADIWDGGQETGKISYLWVPPTQARAYTVASSDPEDVTFDQVLTLTGQPADTNTCTIGTKVYTFQTVLTDVDGNVKIGTDAENTIENLVAAVNLTGGAGYAASMTANEAGISAVKSAADEFTIYALTGIATTETMANAIWGATTAGAGAGAHTLRIYGLKNWVQKEVSEDINLTGVTPVTLANNYVMLNRMEVLTKGVSYINKGNIDATAATDATISARIRALQGRTQMAIYGVPLAQTAYLTRIFANLNITSSNAALADIYLLVNSTPQTERLMYRTEQVFGLQSVGTLSEEFVYVALKKIPGPVIIKMQAVSSTNNADLSGGFDLVLVDN